MIDAQAQVLFGWGVVGCAVSGVIVLGFAILTWFTGSGRWPR